MAMSKGNLFMTPPCFPFASCLEDMPPGVRWSRGFPADGFSEAGTAPVKFAPQEIEVAVTGHEHEACRAGAAGDGNGVVLKEMGVFLAVHRHKCGARRLWLRW